MRIEKDIRIADAVSFKAGERELVESAVAGDIIGLHNHGTIQIGILPPARRFTHGYPALCARTFPQDWAV